MLLSLIKEVDCQLYKEGFTKRPFRGESRYERNFKRDTKLCKRCRGMGVREQNRAGPKIYREDMLIIYTRGFVLCLKVNLAVSQGYAEKMFPTERKTRDWENAMSLMLVVAHVALLRRPRPTSVKHPPHSMS